MAQKEGMGGGFHASRAIGILTCLVQCCPICSVLSSKIQSKPVFAVFVFLFASVDVRSAGFGSYE